MLVMFLKERPPETRREFQGNPSPCLSEWAGEIRNFSHSRSPTMETFRIERRGGALWARVFSGLDEALVRDMGSSLRETLADGGFQFVVLDLTHSPSVNSAGFGFLVKLQTALTTRGMRLFLGNPGPAILEELEVRDLSAFFAVLDQLDEDADEAELELYASS
jgi:anti-anti-sigma regulatory factor